MTLYFPNWSEMVLNTKAWVGPAGSTPSVSEGSGT